MAKEIIIRKTGENKLLEVGFDDELTTKELVAMLAFAVAVGGEGYRKCYRIGDGQELDIDTAIDVIADTAKSISKAKILEGDKSSDCPWN